MSKKRIVEIRKEIKALQEELVRAEKNLYFVCEKCKKRKSIKNLTVFNGESYIYPHGCTGGDRCVLYSYMEVYCLHCDNIHEVKEGSTLENLIMRRGKRVIIYRDSGKGEIARKRQFKELLNEG